MKTGTRPALIWSAVCAVDFLVVTLVGLAIVASSAWNAVEVRLVVAVNALNTPILDAVAHTVNLVFGPGWALVVALVALIVVAVSSRSWRVGIRAGIVLALAWAIADVVKVIVRRARPDASLLTHVTGVEPTSFSYPSGHTAFAAALMTTLVLVAVRGRAGVVVAAIVVVAVTAWSRVYLGAHYPTDVAASVLLSPVAAITVYHLTALAPPCRLAQQA